MWEQEQASYWKDQARKEARRRKILLIVALLAASVFMAVRWMRKGEDKGFFARTVIVKKPELNQEHIAWVFLFLFLFLFVVVYWVMFLEGVGATLQSNFVFAQCDFVCVYFLVIS